MPIQIKFSVKTPIKVNVYLSTTCQKPSEENYEWADFGRLKQIVWPNPDQLKTIEKDKEWA